MPSSTPPNKLYKYRAYNVNTLRLLTHEKVYYADPRCFNDPLDCNPTIQIDTDRASLENLCYKMLVAAYGKDHALPKIENHQYESRQYGDYKTNPKAEKHYMQWLASDVKSLLFQEIGKKGVLSLATRWNCPLMWSHYADDHRGLCIEYDLKGNEGNVCPDIKPVNYRHPRSIKISDLIAWKVNGSSQAEAIVHDTFFFAKAPQWRYEREWRNINAASGDNGAPFRMSGIYFGLRCDPVVQTNIVKLLDDEKRPIEFYDIYPLHNTFRLTRRVVDTGEIKERGVRTSETMDLKDSFEDLTETGK